MRSHAVKYAVCVLFACAAAVALAVSLLVVAGPGAEPARAQVAPEATLVGAGDIASCNYNRDYDTAKVVESTITSANAPVSIFTLGDNVYPDGTANQFKNCYDPTWGGSHLGARSDITLKACYELGRKPHRNADSTVGLVPSRSPFSPFLSPF